LIQQRSTIHERIAGYAITAVTILIVAVIVWTVLRCSGLIARKMGDHGLTALSRIMGFLMVCIGVQFVPSGVHELLQSLKM
jgi:multiple antibiotic resistance protein